MKLCTSSLLKTSMLLLATVLLGVSCSAPNVAYFNDMNNGQTLSVSYDHQVCFLPDDKLTIVVKSKDQNLSSLFNLSLVTHRIGTRQTYSDFLCPYVVDKEGNIDFPVLGKIRVVGLTREQVAEKIKNELVRNNLVNDPVLSVDYYNLGFNVLGEVSRPGRYNFDRDHVTILDAISMAGDLTIQGRRQQVMVMRGAGAERTVYRIDLQKGAELLQSPAFYLQQNDVVYVEPNNYRSRQTTVNGNNVLSAPFWISVASLLTSIAVLIVK